MDEELRIISLTELAEIGGAERWDHAFEQLLDNVLDPNRDAQVARTITLKVTVTPDERRSSGKLELHVGTKLAPLSAIGQTVHFGREKDTGIARAVSYDPGQHDLFRLTNDSDVIPINPQEEEA